MTKGAAVRQLDKRGQSFGWIEVDAAGKTVPDSAWAAPFTSEKEAHAHARASGFLPDREYEPPPGPRYGHRAEGRRRAARKRQGGQEQAPEG